MTDTAILGLGYLGRPLAEALYLRGHAVAALKRRYTSDDVALPIALNAADLDDEAVWTQPFWAEHWADKPTWVCLLPPSAVADYAAVLRRWLALAEHFQAAHVVLGSSISVYGDAPRLCDEHSPPQPATASARACVAAETIVLDSAVPQVSVLRLGGLYSAARHPLNRLLQRQPLPQPQAAANMLHQDRAVAALLHAIAHPQGRRIRNIVETPPPTREDFYTAQAALLGLPPPQFDPGDTRPGKVLASCYDDVSF
ncbi:nucleoside-diphosphate-sugar epimerase [Neisseria sp. HSC-16F19]|nr:SDR family NAD(P)-dependent oxidoreductase [Neisseria sp. HSC-16F19]MCP2040517.1 nucleoside-diphosphate-sugar epimerase [Neisseria sp. HSC-16F19]